MRRYRDTRARAAYAFQNRYNATDKYIEDILFGDSCAHIKPSLTAICNKFAAGSQSKGLLSILTLLDTVISNAVFSFLASPRTRQDSADNDFNAIYSSVNLGNIIMGLNDCLTSYLEVRFSNEVTTLLHMNFIRSAAGLVLLLLLAILLYVTTLKYIKRKH